jgi:hypothetical protein
MCRMPCEHTTRPADLGETVHWHAKKNPVPVTPDLR